MERTPLVRSKLLSIIIGRMQPKATQGVNGAPQFPPATVGLVDQNRNQPPSPPFPQPVISPFEQARQQQQQQRDENWARPPPHPSDRRALTPITERSTRDSNSWDTNTNPPPLHRPGLSIVNGSPLQPDQIQKQQSDTSQDLPKLQTDAEPSTFFGEAIVTSPTSHIPLHEFGIGRADSVVSFGSKPDPNPSKQEPASLSGSNPKVDTHGSTDPIRPKGSPLSSPGKESVSSAQLSPHPHQPIQSTFSDIPKTPPRSPHRPTFTPPITKGPGAESGSPAPGSSSRLDGAIQRKEGSSLSNSLAVATKSKTPELSSPQQTDLHPNSATFSPTPTTVNSLPTLTHTATTTSTSKSEYSGYSDGSRPSPPQHSQGTFSSPDQLNQDSRPRSSQSRRAVLGETFQKETLSTSLPGNVGAAKPNGGKEGSGDSQDFMKEAGALYYIQESEGGAVVQPSGVTGGSQNAPESSGNDGGEGERDPSSHNFPRPLQQQIQTQFQPRQPPEPSPLQLRRPSAQAKTSLPLPPPPPPPLVSQPQYPIQPSPYPPQNQYQDHGYSQGPDQQPILAPQPQQPVTSSFNPVKTMEGDVRSPDSYYQGGDANDTSPVVDSKRTSVIGPGGGSRPGQASRPSGARDLVLKQRAGTSDSVSSHSRHNGQPQPRHPLPPHPESPSEQPSQTSYSTYTRPSHHQGQIFAQSLGETTQIPHAIGTTDRHLINMAGVDRDQHYDDNSDALAALTFLERDESHRHPQTPSLRHRAGPTSGTKAPVYETPPVHITPSENRDDVSQDSGSYEGQYKSSFAPSKQASQRLAKTQAQQAAHQAAAHRPGKSGGANGKGKKRLRQDGWAESSEEEDDEDVDSDGDPIAQSQGQGPGTGPGKNLGRLSAQGSPYGSSTDLNHPGQGRAQRNLPRPPSPGHGYGMSFPADTFLIAIPFHTKLFFCRRSRLSQPPRARRIWTVHASLHSVPRRS